MHGVATPRMAAYAHAEYLNYNKEESKAAAKAAVNITKVMGNPDMDVGRAETNRDVVARASLPDLIKPKNPFSKGVSMYADYLTDSSR